MKIIKRTEKAVVFVAALAIILFTRVSPPASAAGVKSSAGAVSIASGSLNVRNSADTSGTVVAKLARGTYITLVERSGDWWHVKYADSAYGYVNAAYVTCLTGVSAAVVVISSGNLNVRSGAGAAYSIQAKLGGGSNVLVLSSSGDWCRILYGGSKTGYVNAKYLSPQMTWPVPASMTINQAFISGSHLGIDIGSSAHGVSGDSTVAALAGKVVYSGYISSYGYVVYINSIYNGQYIQTRYAHLASQPIVSAGGTVAAGQKIGVMGSTGTGVTGVHLHFEVRIRASSADCVANTDSTPVNPLNYF